LPNLTECAEWDTNGTTILYDPLLRYRFQPQPQTIFIDTNNNIYVTDPENHRIHRWFYDSANSEESIFHDISKPHGLFVSTNGDIYFSDQQGNCIYKWSANQNTIEREPVTCFGYECSSIFISVNNMLYCSMQTRNQIVTKSLVDRSNVAEVVAGNGSHGNAPNMLHSPLGIFVDTDLNLYVADYSNSRIQLFPHEKNDSKTVVDLLRGPTSVILDANNNTYIVDRSNHSIVRSGPNGLQCIIGCTGSRGSSSSQLDLPTSMAFDSDGNIYVVDAGNKRIQLFVLASNCLCCISMNQTLLKITHPFYFIFFYNNRRQQHFVQ